MIVDRQIAPYVVRSDVPLREALRRIDSNNRGIVFCIDDDGVLEGVLTDGDFRRSCLELESVRMSEPVLNVAKLHIVSAPMDAAPNQVDGMLSDMIQMVPLLDGSGRIVGLARRRSATDVVWIGGRPIGPDRPCFVIAEIGINHNGSKERARQLIDAAAAAEVDCVKFQMRNLEALYREAALGKATAEDLGAQYTLDLLTRFALPPEVMLELFDYARSRDLTVLCTPWDLASLNMLEDYGMEGYKTGFPTADRIQASVAMPRRVSNGGFAFHVRPWKLLVVAARFWRMSSTLGYQSRR